MAVLSKINNVFDFLLGVFIKYTRL